MEWKTITDYPNYQISNCGLIKNKKENFLKSRDNNHGYEIVNLCNEGKTNILNSSFSWFTFFREK